MPVATIDTFKRILLKPDNVTLEAKVVGDSLALVAGSGITLTANGDLDEITITNSASLGLVTLDNVLLSGNSSSRTATVGRLNVDNIVIDSNAIQFSDSTIQNTAWTGLPIASNSVLGGVKIDASSITINGSVISVPAVATIGQNNGIATLGADGKLTSAQIPTSLSGAIIFKGTWNASTNTPTLVDGTGQNGWQYTVTIAGTVNLGSGSITFVPGDFIIYNGSIWQKIAANTIAAAGTLTGATLASGVTASSLTSVGTLINLTVTNTISGNINGNAGTVTNGVYTTDTGTVTNTMLSGSIANTKLTNSSVTIGSTAVSLGSTVTTFAGLTSVTSTTFVGALTGNAATVTNGVYTTDTGTVTNTMLSGSIANNKLTNSTISSKALGTNLDTLTLNTSGTGLSGSTTYNGSGAATFTVASNATSANTVSAIVARDANGNFSAGTIIATITGSVSGNAGTVTNGVYTTGSYADPAWITSLAASKVGLGSVTNESKATMFASPTFKDSILASTTVAGANFNLFSNLTGFQSLTIAGGNLTTGTDKYVYIGTGTNHATSTTEVQIGSLTSGSLTKIWSPLTVVGNIGASNLSGTNTGDQTIPTTLPASDVYAWAKAATKPSYTATEVGLGNVTNESKATMFASPTFTGTVSGVTKAHVGLGSVDNTADSAKSVSYAATAGGAPATDVYAWAKAATKPSYTATEVGLGNVTNESKATMFASPTFTGTVASFTVKDSILASTTVAGGTFNLFSNLTGFQGLLIAGGNLTTGTDKYVYIGTGGVALNGNHATSTTEVHIGGNTSGSLTKIWSPLTVTGNIGASNFSGSSSGTNTGDQTIPTTLPASDVYAWAKAATKPSYTATEVGLGNVNNTADATKAVSSASTATTAANLAGGNIYSNSSGQGYSTAVQVREASVGGAAQGTGMAFAPRLAFHWGGVVASSIAVENSGRIGIFNNPGTAYEAFVCGTLTASNFSGSSSGTNTGDQTLPTLASLGAAPTASPTFTGTVSGVTATHVGLGNVTNESKATMFASPTFTGNAAINTAGFGQGLNGDILTVGTVGSDVIINGGSNSGGSIRHRYATGSMGVYGGGQLTTGLVVASTGVVTINATTTATSSTTGALVVSGGVGIGGDIVAAGSVTAAAFYYSSDATLKTNIGTLTNYWETLDALRPVSFDWISSGKKDLGLLAQDVQSVMPGSVTTTNDGTLAISSSGIIANLVAAVKDLKQQVEELTKQLKG